MNLQITPAILTDNLNEAKELAEKYILLGTEQIDIDVAVASFGKQTISLEQAVELVIDLSQKYELEPLFWGFDVAIDNAQAKLELLLPELLSAQIQPRIYLSTKCGEVAYLWLLDQPVYKGLVIDADIGITLQYPWHEFDEVQLMTVKSRTQGQKFEQNLLSKALKLREKGFENIISIDGGINLESAAIISDYVKQGIIERLSVGSYFQHSTELELSRDKLVLALAL